ncbi:MAG: hypothetical protein CVV29_11990 [Methanobacteriales archaeon HGW-Methanobacteriales-2]|nr:MAG: hypothetical protein CVV29_11990 [Methanobacteriales archaeon HGW-Methanobacteriales-2]
MFQALRQILGLFKRVQMQGAQEPSREANNLKITFIPFRFRRITRLQGGGDEAYFTYVEDADDEANKVSRRKRIGINFSDRIF